MSLLYFLVKWINSTQGLRHISVLRNCITEINGYNIYIIISHWFLYIKLYQFFEGVGVHLVKICTTNRTNYF